MEERDVDRLLARIDGIESESRRLRYSFAALGILAVATMFGASRAVDAPGMIEAEHLRIRNKSGICLAAFGADDTGDVSLKFFDKQKIDGDPLLDISSLQNDSRLLLSDGSGNSRIGLSAGGDGEVGLAFKSSGGTQSLAMGVAGGNEVVLCLRDEREKQRLLFRTEADGVTLAQLYDKNEKICISIQDAGAKGRAWTIWDVDRRNRVHFDGRLGVLIKDQQNRSCIFHETDNTGSARLGFSSWNNRMRFMIYERPDERAGLTFFYPDGKPCLGIDDQPPVRVGMTVLDPEERPRLGIGLISNGPSGITIWDQDRKQNLQIPR